MHNRRAVAGRTHGVVSTHDQLWAVCVTLHESRLHALVNRTKLLGCKPITVNQTDRSGRTPLIHLCCHGNARCVRKFAELNNIQVNWADHEGNTCLHYAAEAGHSDVVQTIVDKFPDVNVNSRNAQGLTPLHKACVQGRTDCARILIENGADTHAVDKCRQLDCAQWALHCGRHECARQLILILPRAHVHHSCGHPHFSAQTKKTRWRRSDSAPSRSFCAEFKMGTASRRSSSLSRSVDAPECKRIFWWKRPAPSLQYVTAPSDAHPLQYSHACVPAQEISSQRLCVPMETGKQFE